MDVTSSLRSLLPYGRRSIGINQLVSKLETYLPPEDVERAAAAVARIAASAPARSAVH